jgi:ribosome-binding protein aMBF1 (putative translation factor)
MGRWEPISSQIWDTVTTPCDCCGQVVASRQWIVEVEGSERRFCGERCENLFITYVLPRRAAAAPAS